MKTYLKILVWLGMGLGIGFFAGEQVGERIERKRHDCEPSFEEVDMKEKCEEYEEAMAEYSNLSSEEGLDKILGRTVTDDEDDIPDIPTAEELVIPGEEPEIPQLHPTHFEPRIIPEDEFNRNEKGLDIEPLTFYELDEVLYNKRTQSIIENPDDVVGIGTLFAFHVGPNPPLDTIYVENETFGTLFRIDRIDGAFCDIVDGQASPTDDDDDSDDFWNDV